MSENVIKNDSFKSYYAAANIGFAVADKYGHLLSWAGKEALGEILKNNSTRFGAVGVGYYIYKTFTDNNLSDEAKAGNIAVNVAVFAVTATASAVGGIFTAPIAMGVGVALTVASMALTDEQMEAIGSKVLEVGENQYPRLLDEIAETTGDFQDNYYGNELGYEVSISTEALSNFVNCLGDLFLKNRLSQINDEINAETTADLQVFTADEITAMLDSQGFNGAELWNNFTETLTNIFQAQVEMEMEMQNYMGDNTIYVDPFAVGNYAQHDPIVLDLNGDGVTTTNVQENYVNFDLNVNGFAERTGWIDGNDGFLVRDINGNGKIDDGTEMFGDKTLLKNGKTASNGYIALKELDGNGDGKIDSKDTAYNELKIWKDSNSNGVTDNGELFTLAELGIESINTNYTYKNTKDENTNTVYGTGTYTPFFFK